MVIEFNSIPIRDFKEKHMDDLREMTLADTSEMMNSTDYKERFKAEYYQVGIRYHKLYAMIVKWDKGELNFKPTCPRSLYDLQLKAMADYMAVLEARAMIEKIEL